MTCQYSCKKIDLSELFPEKTDAFAVTLDNVFTKEECQSLIKRTKEVGYTPALVGKDQVRVPENRNNYRCMIDDKDLAGEIFNRIKDHIPDEWMGNPVSRLNERLRFLRYHPGEYFKPHNDGIYVSSDKSECSYVTIHLYLNDVIEGGCTNFTTEPKNYMTRKLEKKQGKSSNNHYKCVSVEPKLGRILIFEHHLVHEGAAVTEGVKYTVRSDVMYHNTKPVRTSRWNSGFPFPQYKGPCCSGCS